MHDKREKNRGVAGAAIRIPQGAIPKFDKALWPISLCNLASSTHRYVWRVVLEMRLYLNFNDASDPFLSLLDLSSNFSANFLF